MPTIDEVEAKVGEEVGVSDWITVDQARINAFAENTGDHQFIHLDPERAKAETPFGGTIAHGFLTLSLLSQMGGQALPAVEGVTFGVNYGFDYLRFL
nr:MaoC family dehydratase [Euryhalocaulis sp.]